MTLENLRQYTHFSKYSLFQKVIGRKETRYEAGHRKFNMHREKYRTAGQELHNLIDESEKAFHDEFILGSQRALQYGGDAALKKNARIYNCVSSYCDRPRFFQECFWLLLCGNGTGFSAQIHDVAKLPEISRPKGNGSTFVYQIPDTIEGWADAAGVLMSSYFAGDVPFPEAQGRWVEFDYSLIRAEGAKLSSGAGKAPGPEPLRKSLENVREVLEGVVEDIGSKLRPIDAYDIVMFLADAVLSGGVRRSATICLFSLEDEEMMAAKTGNWATFNPQRANSNNSVMLLRGSVTDEEFHRIKELTKEWGEPGFVWTDSYELLVNPCVEIGQYAKCHRGDAFPTMKMSPGQALEILSGWQFCNLSVINAAKTKTEEDFLYACRSAAIVGTLQAGYTDFDYLGPVSEYITRREALLGVSMTGMMDSPEIAFDYDLQRRGAKVVLDVNEYVAELIGIRPAARATCIKPEGTSSCYLGTASGIHAHHARRFIRNNRANQNEGVAQHFQSVNPAAVEVCQRNPDKNMILSFLVELPEGAVTKDDVSSIEMLERVRMTRQAWVEGGRRPHLCTQPWLSHNVSNTINVKDNEWDECFDYVSKHREDFAGVAMLGHFGDLDYAQAPFVAVRTLEELEIEYDVAMIYDAEIVLSYAQAYGDLWTACMKLLTEHIPLEYGTQQVFHKAATRFAYDWTCSDIKEATYLLKRVHIANRWRDLQASMKDVDYTLMTEDDGMRIEAIQACAGGRCEI